MEKFSNKNKVILPPEEAQFQSNTLSGIYKNRLQERTILENNPEVQLVGVDSFKNGSLFGKIDFEGNVILPKKDLLVHIQDEFTDINDFKINPLLETGISSLYYTRRVDFATNKNNIAEIGEKIFIIDSAYDTDPIEKYYEICTNHISEVFLEEEDLSSKVSDFYSFVDFIITLLKNKEISKKILLSEFILSSDFSPTDTGLAYDIDNDVDPSDREGVKQAYNDNPDFINVSYLLLENGIRYDQNVPWRFYLDLSSEYFFTNYFNNNSNKDLSQAFFEEYYYPVQGTLLEFEVLFELFYKSYLKIYNEDAYYYKINNKCNYNSYLRKRKYLNYKDFKSYFKKNLKNNILKEYIKILNIIYKPETHYMELLKKIAPMKKRLDISKLVGYTYNTLKNCSKQTRRTNVFSNTSKQGISSRSSY